MKIRLLLMVLVGTLGSCSPQPPPASQPESAAAPPIETPAIAQPSSDAPPTVDGVYVNKGACPGEGCYLGGKIKARRPVGLLQQARADSAVIATIAEGEWVEILGREDRLVPHPGKRKSTGETVYMLGYEGEGCSSIWEKGGLSSWCDDDGDPSNDDIVWDPRIENKDPTLGFWVEVKRADGQAGWLAEGGSGFACTGFQDRDADCPPLPQ